MRASRNASEDGTTSAVAAHLDWARGEFWREIPGFADIDSSQFRDHRWQAKASVTRLDQLAGILGPLLTSEVARDFHTGLSQAPMALRLSPYLLARIDWRTPLRDPIRRQFLPAASDGLALGDCSDHPCSGTDSLAERIDSPTAGLTHRYPDRVLFLALDTCPVYCRFCTRSYAVGRDTARIEKISLSATPNRWRSIFEYIRATPAVEDVVISGGDCYNLRPDQIRKIGHTLLEIPHIRRMRYATKGPAVNPTKLLSDEPWVDALCDVVGRGRSLGKSVALHTHFNHPHEITDITHDALMYLFERGVTVRNQSVLQCGVNDSVQTMTTLIRRLGRLNVQPYYVYVHDLVPGVEALRTSLDDALEIERGVRGATAGYNTPTFVVDAPGGGGKRDAHSFDYYDRETGISVFRSPNIDAQRSYCYFDPIHRLSREGQKAWATSQPQALIQRAIARAQSNLPPRSAI